MPIYGNKEQSYLAKLFHYYAFNPEIEINKMKINEINIKQIINKCNYYPLNDIYVYSNESSLYYKSKGYVYDLDGYFVFCKADFDYTQDPYNIILYKEYNPSYWNVHNTRTYIFRNELEELEDHIWLLWCNDKTEDLNIKDIIILCLNKTILNKNCIDVILSYI